MPSSPSPFSVYTPFLRRFTDEAARDVSETITLYERVSATHANSIWSTEGLDRLRSFIATEVKKAVTTPDYEPVLEAFDECIRALLAHERTIFEIPTPAFHALTMKEHVDLRRELRAKEYFHAHESRILDDLADAIITGICGILRTLPPIPDEDYSLKVPLYDVIPNLADVLDRIIGTFVKPAHQEIGIFYELMNRLYDNVCEASGVDPHADSKRPLVAPSDSDLEPKDLIDTYLTGTPFKCGIRCNADTDSSARRTSIR